MITDLTKLTNIVKNIIDDITNSNNDNIPQLSLKYINELSNILEDSYDWPIFNSVINDTINNYAPIDFSKNIFLDLYYLIFNYFNLKFENIQAVQLNNLNSISSIFDEENIVTEKVWGATIKNDMLYQSPPIDTDEVISEFKAVEDLTYMLDRKTFMDYDMEKVNVEYMPDESSVETKPENKDEEQERTSPNTIVAAFNVVRSVNDFGQLMLKGSTCPVCGKHVDFIPSNGYCSLQCAGIDLLRKAKESLSGEYLSVSEKVQHKIDMVKNILDYVNLTLNVFAKIPDVLSSISRLPEEYKNYAIQKVNIIFLSLKRIINKLLILKNKIIIQLLKRIKFGTIDDKVAAILPSINAIINLSNQLKMQLTNALNVAYNAILKISGQFYIGPQEMGFFMTLKSLQCVCTQFKTDVATYPPEQLGRPYWGPGIFNIAFDMSKCQFSMEIGAKSALQNRDFKKINAIIKKAFRPITEVEYLMDTDLFEVRLALSDQNATTIQKLVNMLSKTVVLGGDLIPSYENLSLLNPWYIIAILTCWGPLTQKIYGDFIYHGYI